MKRFVGSLAFLMISVCAWSQTQTASILTDQFAVSLPFGFQAQKPQVIEGRTKWTYLREHVADQSDCRFRVTVLEGSKAIPDDSTGAQLALALLIGYTAQQTKSLVDLRFDAVNKITMRGRIWWRAPWTARNGDVSIAGLSYITAAYDAEYFLIFESLSSVEGSKVSTEILTSFEPKKPANQAPQPTPSGRG